MNANELANKLERDGEGCTCSAYCAGECACDANWAEYHTKEAVTMLRQQQAEIEALKALLVEEQDESFDRTASHMAGEYVSYKAELTDEEILKLEEIEFDNYCVDKESKGRKTATITDPEWAIWFARAILRKAQEK